MWKDFLVKKKTKFVVTVIILAIILFIYPRFLEYVEAREGVVLNDPVLKLFGPVNLTWLIFSLIYLSLIAAIFRFLKKPELLLLALQSYSLLTIFRIIVMYAAALDPPEGMISLNDPFVQFFGNGEVLTKDLFFSGHTATLFLLFLISEKKLLKYLFLTCTIIVGISVLLQHVHYTLDVVSAPFFAYTSYKIVVTLHKRFNI